MWKTIMAAVAPATRIAVSSQGFDWTQKNIATPFTQSHNNCHSLHICVRCKCSWSMCPFAIASAGLPQHTETHSNDDMEIKPINAIDSLETRSQSSLSEDLPVDASSTPTPPVRNSTINIPDGGALSSLGGNLAKSLILNIHSISFHFFLLRILFFASNWHFFFFLFRIPFKNFDFELFIIIILFAFFVVVGFLCELVSVAVG